MPNQNRSGSDRPSAQRLGSLGSLRAVFNPGSVFEASISAIAIDPDP
ncbi:MAG: hypothetical protein ABR556_13830 [Pyrinomonadaceae bacterium]